MSLLEIWNWNLSLPACAYAHAKRANAGFNYLDERRIVDIAIEAGRIERARECGDSFGVAIVLGTRDQPVKVSGIGYRLLTWTIKNAQLKEHLEFKVTLISSSVKR